MKCKTLILMMMISSTSYSKLCDYKSDTAEDPRFLTPLVRKIPIPKRAQYFVKVHPDKDILYFSGGGANIYDYSRPDKPNLFKVEGPYDPVPTADGEFVTTPENADGLRFYKVNNENGAYETVFSDREMGDNYHSAGILSENPKRYRFMNRGNRELYIKDYEVSKNGNKMKELTSKRAICTNLTNEENDPEQSYSFDIPMMSKSGKFVGVSFGGSMKIVKINEDDSCDISHDLGIETGKLEFDFDDKFAVFHTNELSPEGEYAQNIFKFDMETGSVTPLTDFNGNSDEQLAQFPAIKRNGNVVFRTNADMFYEIENESLNGVKLMGSYTCESGKKVDLPFAALSYWKQVCEKITGVSSDKMGYLRINLDQTSCEEIKKSYVEILKNSKEKISTEDIALGRFSVINSPLYREIDPAYLCPKEIFKNFYTFDPDGVVDRLPQGVEAKKPKFYDMMAWQRNHVKEDAVPTSCRQCHSTVNWDDPESLGQESVNSPLAKAVFKSNRSTECFPEQALYRIKADKIFSNGRIVSMPAGEQESLISHDPEAYDKLVPYLEEAMSYCDD